MFDQLRIGEPTGQLNEPVVVGYWGYRMGTGDGLAKPKKLNRKGNS